MKISVRWLLKKHADICHIHGASTFWPGNTIGKIKKESKGTERFSMGRALFLDVPPTNARCSPLKLMMREFLLL